MITWIILAIQGLAAIFNLIQEIDELIEWWRNRNPAKAAVFEREREAGIALFQARKDRQRLRRLRDTMRRECDELECPSPRPA